MPQDEESPSVTRTVAAGNFLNGEGERDGDAAADSSLELYARVSAIARLIDIDESES